MKRLILLALLMCAVTAVAQTYSVPNIYGTPTVGNCGYWYSATQLADAGFPCGNSSFASPGPIGGTTPSTGNFTTVVAGTGNFTALTATTQAANSSDNKVATDQTVINAFATPPTAGYGSTTPEPVAATNVTISGAPGGSYVKADGTGYGTPSSIGNTTSTSLTAGYIPKASGENAIVSSALDDGTSTPNTLTYTGSKGLALTGGGTPGSTGGLFSPTHYGTDFVPVGADSQNAYRVLNAAESLIVFDVDTLYNRVGINTTTPAHSLDVVGDAHVSGALNSGSIPSPGPIGGATPSTVNATTVTATSFVGPLTGNAATASAAASLASTPTLCTGGQVPTGISASGNAVGCFAPTGSVSTASLPLAITGANIAIAQANGSTNGYLSSTDWSTFNGKFNGASCTNDGSGNVTCTSFTTPQLTTPDSQLLRPGSGVANPRFYRGWTGPTNPATEAYSIIMPDAVPTAGQAIVAGVPSGSPAVSQGTWATPLTTSAVVTVAQGGTGLATLTAHAVQVGEGTSTPAQVGPNTATTYPLFSAGSSADPAFRAIAAGDIPATAVPAVAVPTPGASITLTGPSGFAICTTTCTVAVPVPVAGYQFCIMNDDNVSTAITLSALGSSARYENSARTAYGTAGTGTLVVAAAAADMVCIVGRDSTHYFTTTSSGVVTVN